MTQAISPFVVFHYIWLLFRQVEADSLRLQIAAQPNPELRAKLEEAGVQVDTLVCGCVFWKRSRFAEGSDCREHHPRYTNFDFPCTNNSFGKLVSSVYFYVQRDLNGSIPTRDNSIGIPA